MKLKRIISFLLVLCLLTAVAGCGESEPTPSASKGKKKKQKSSKPTESVSEQVTSSEKEQNTEPSSVQPVSGQQSYTGRTTEKTSGKKTKLAFSGKLTPLFSDGDSLLLENPDRGFRTHLDLNVKEAVDSGDPTAYYYKDYNVFFAYCHTPVTTAVAYLYLTEYRGMDLPKEAISAIEEFFEFCKIKNFKINLLFAYCNDHNDLTTCADQSTILRHIKQLAPVVKKYKDCIHSVDGGFIGSYGEWATVYQVPAVDYETVIRALMKYFCMPNGLYLLLRLPQYKNLIPKTDKFYPYIGYKNDAMYGEQSKEGWNSGGYQYGTPEWAQVCEEGAYTPQGGELDNNGNYYRKGMVPSGMEIIKETAHHWQNTMSVWHGKYEPHTDEAIMDLWEKEAVTPSALAAEKVVYDPNWFKNSQGKTVNRNAFEFIRDHLGYRISAQTVQIAGENKPGSTAQVKMTLKNYGMSAAFNMQSGFAILDADYNPVSTVKAGKPETWYSHDPKNYLDTAVLTHTVGAELKLPTASGHYYVAFYLKNSMGQFARLANKTDTADGYMILREFDL